eukprot:TRINITY_DN50448_c0_g1_i1.p1 TRINITY_DN50448_c0_g1~~TRINITY_DN50448_c0_g1_i1.p1  ORF type:complete len:124 (-),score=20.08 TRINITY_DN50448_c0_g1_i1:274-645(-)
MRGVLPAKAMNAKLTPDGTGRDGYMLQVMRDFQANACGSLVKRAAQFRTPALREWSHEYDTTPRPRRSQSTVPAPGDAATEVRDGKRAVSAARQRDLCCKLSVPTELRRRQRRFTVEAFVKGI